MADNHGMDEPEDIISPPERMVVTLTEGAVYANGAPVYLSHSERSVFNAIARHDEGIATPEELIEGDYAKDKKQLERFVMGIRVKFKRHSKESVIITMRHKGGGRQLAGYAFNADLIIK